jgi:tetratricopeptide (TPR) repeat protein
MRERFDRLQQQARDRFAAGELRRAVELFAESEELALSNDRQDLADRAFCNRCAVLIELEEGHDQIPALKQVLLRSSDPKTRYLASYYTAEAFRGDEDWERALTYARRASELADQLDEAPAHAAVANLLGTVAMRSCSYQEAEQAFERALDCYNGATGYRRLMEAQVRDNLGYVRMCNGRLAEGLRLCEEARLSFERLEAEHYLYETLQDLCYGYILDDRLDRAVECGELALELAIEHSDALIAKNCLFLLSEIAVRQGDSFRARRYLRELIAHYPDVGLSEEIIDVFLATDLTAVVNLRG